MRPDSPDEFDRNPEMPVPTGKYTDFTDSTRDEALFHCSDSIGIPRCPSQFERRLDFAEAIQEDP